jgi:hypothetical protein
MERGTSYQPGKDLSKVAQCNEEPVRRVESDRAALWNKEPVTSIIGPRVACLCSQRYTGCNALLLNYNRTSLSSIPATELDRQSLVQSDITNHKRKQTSVSATEWQSDE